MDNWQAEVLTLIETARRNADGCDWVWAFRAIDIARQHIEIPYGILGHDTRPDLDALEATLKDDGN